MGPTPNQHRFLQDRLAALSAAQRKAKRARKRLPEVELAALRRELTGRDDPSWSAAADVIDRRIRITALLNVYHEIRGSAHRHGIRTGREFDHEVAMTLLRQHLAELA